jgi:hypothetical protein
VRELRRGVPEQFLDGSERVPAELESVAVAWLNNCRLNAGGVALIANRNDPLSAHRTCPWTALAADDDPIDAIKADRPEVFKQRLTRQKAHCDIAFLEANQARQTMLPVLDDHALPEVSNTAANSADQTSGNCYERFLAPDDNQRSSRSA